METLVATVLIVVIFMVASMTLNNLFGSSIRNNTQEIRYHMAQLRYLHENGKLTLPYHAEEGDWAIEVARTEWRGKREIVFMAQNEMTNKELVYTLSDAAQ